MKLEIGWDQAASRTVRPSSGVEKVRRMVARLGPGLLLVAVLSLAAHGLAGMQEWAFGRAWIEGLGLALLLGVAVSQLVPDLRRCEAGALYAGSRCWSWRWCCSALG